jgi:hypothetical protein
MKLKEIYIKAGQQGKNEIRRFMRDMKRAGYKMQWYQGRFWWNGPAVETGNGVDLQDILGATKVKCQWDNMGLDLIVYPIESL